MLKLSSAAIAAASVIAFTQVAAAADMPVKAPIRPAAPVVIPYNWTGLYIGGHLGCAWADQTIKRITVEDDEPPESAFVNIGTNSNGCFGGGQIGFNYQFANNVVLGIEADASWGKLKSSGAAPEGDEELIPFNQELKSFGTVRGRLGYAFGQWLPYVTGGWAWGRNKLTVYAFDDDLITSDTRTHSGWTVGAGLEYLINRNWSVKVEYLYLDLGTETYNNVAFFDAAFPGADLDLKLHTVKLGLNYKFDWGIPMRP